MYAERKGWALDSVEVRLRHGRIHAKDCEDCETKEGMLDEIQSQIHLEGDLDEVQRNRLLEIATRCPVHRTLTSEIKIRCLIDCARSGSKQGPWWQESKFAATLWVKRKGKDFLFQYSLVFAPFQSGLHHVDPCPLDPGERIQKVVRTRGRSEPCPKRTTPCRMTMVLIDQARGLVQPLSSPGILTSRFSPEGDKWIPHEVLSKHWVRSH